VTAAAAAVTAPDDTDKLSAIELLTVVVVLLALLGSPVAEIFVPTPARQGKRWPVR
jgi:hypothetical protein